MSVWPSSLPAFLIEGFQEAVQDIALRTEMDAGPPKVRRRYTAAYRTIKGEMALTAAQVATLDAFYLAEAGNAFTFTHPRTGATVGARFAGPPQYSRMATATPHWRASVEIEVLP